MTLSDKELSRLGFYSENDTILRGNGLGLKYMLRAGKQWLELHAGLVNALNVFPVPDGDTGTNMLLTMRSVLEKIEPISEQENVGVMAAVAADGALMGARGNSGVILSQFLRGIATSLQGKSSFTAIDFVLAVELGVEQAYQTVVTPVEGTILTVARKAVEDIQKGPDLLACLIDMLKAAKLAQAHTPELLPILKETGVTDAGGQGFVYILEGFLRLLQNKSLTELSDTEVPVLKATQNLLQDSYGYDVQFLIQGDGLQMDEIRDQLNQLGWSTIVIGDEKQVKVHLHTHDPGVPISYGVQWGLVTDVVVENMEEQAKEFVPLSGGGMATSPIERSAPTQTDQIGIVAVVPGRGLARIFQSLGVSQTILGGQTQNPSVEELLTAIQHLNTEQVLILPNNQNIILVAQQAQRLSQKMIEVVPTQTIPQGIIALFEFNYQADLEYNMQRMSEAMQDVQTIEITHAVREQTYGSSTIKVGDTLGFLDNELISVGQKDEQVALDLLAKIEDEAAEMITIYFGQDVTSSEAEQFADQLEKLYPNIEIEVHNGEQPHYSYIISVE